MDPSIAFKANRVILSEIAVRTNGEAAPEAPRFPLAGGEPEE
jgi:hypothetical protein